MKEPRYEVVWPLGKSVFEPVHLPSRSADLEGKTVCELWDWAFRGHEIFPMLRGTLSKHFPGIKFVNYDVFGDTHGPDERDAIAKLPDLLRKHKCDAAISGVGA